MTNIYHASPIHYILQALVVKGRIFCGLPYFNWFLNVRSLLQIFSDSLLLIGTWNSYNKPLTLSCPRPNLSGYQGKLMICCYLKPNLLNACQDEWSQGATCNPFCSYLWGGGLKIQGGKMADRWSSSNLLMNIVITDLLANKLMQKSLYMTQKICYTIYEKIYGI